MNNDLITIVVPVYNVERYLYKCVNSIINQTYKNMEIILVDDGSTDKSSLICDELAKQDSRIVVLHKQNGGLSSARNAGIEFAKGKYIGFIDSDDYIDERMFELLHNALIDNNADLSVCNYSWVNEDGVAFNSTNLSSCVYDAKEVLEKYLLDDMASWVIACNKLYNIHLFCDIKYPVGKINEDSFVIHKILDKCTTIATTEESLYMYLQRSDSIMNSSFKLSSLDVVESHYDRTEYYLNSSLNNRYEVATKSLLKSLSSFHSCYYGVDKKHITKECRKKNKELQRKYRQLYKECKKCKTINKSDRILLFLCWISIFKTYTVFDLLKR